MCTGTRGIVLSFVILSLGVLCNSAESEEFVLDSFTWQCANNASCVNAVATNVISRFQRKESLNFGLFRVEPIEPKPTFGRSNSFLDFFNGNAVRVPIGPMVFSVQRADNDDNYLEIALLKKSDSQGRGRKRIGLKDKKHLQMMIPMFLAANAIGWTLLAIKSVGILTLKALLVSKLAFLLTSGIILKRLMDKATEKMMIAPYPEHHEQSYVMPYNMEYAIPAHSLSGAEIGPSELYSIQMTNPHEIAHPDIGGMGAESSLSHAVEVQNATQPQHIIAALSGAVNKVKRDDNMWTGVKRKPNLYNYLMPNNPVYVYRKM